jgi:hypothetical protein
VEVIAPGSWRNYESQILNTTDFVFPNDQSQSNHEYLRTKLTNERDKLYLGLWANLMYVKYFAQAL